MKFKMLRSAYHRVINWLSSLVYQPFDSQYQTLIRNVLKHGTSLSDRTGVGRVSLPNQSITVDLRIEDPVLTLRQIPIKAPINEMLGFLKGVTTHQGFEALGCKFWQGNANDPKWMASPWRTGEGHLGSIYGYQWRKWPAFKTWINDTQRQALCEAGWSDVPQTNLMTRQVDQVVDVVLELMVKPNSRRTLWHAWNPADLHSMVLPPCHMVYQFVRLGGDLHLTVYQRSGDVILGICSNVLQGAALLRMIAHITRTTPATLRYVVGDAHVYLNHLKAANRIIDAKPSHKIPRLEFSDRLQADTYITTRPLVEDWLNRLQANDVRVVDYHSDLRISADELQMAV